MNNQITHEGEIIAINGRDIQVRIVQNSACSGCHAKAACTAADSAEKIITADSEGLSYSVGENVTVIVCKSMAWRAVLWAFGIPIVLAMVILFACEPFLGGSLACVSALGALVLYFLVFYLLRNRINTDYHFTLSRKFE